MEKRRFFGLDLIKILATTIIVFHHYQQVFELRFATINFFDGRFSFGYLVELFFVISGFLTFYSDKAVGGYLSKFSHKLLRIFPMVTVACVVTLIAESIAVENIGALWNAKTLIANFLLLFSGWPFFQMTGINNPTWYLCVLIQCYIVFYSVHWISIRIKVQRVWLDIGVIIVAFVMCRFHLIQEGTYRGLEAFSIGTVLCSLKDRFSKRKLVFFISAIVGLIISIFFQQRRLLTFFVFPIFVALCALWQGTESERINEQICKFGKVSFEVYVWHYPLMALEKMIFRLVETDISRSFITMMVFTSLTWIAAFFLYKFVEVPISKFFGKRCV